MPNTDEDSFWNHFKRTPDQARWEDIRNRLLEIEDHIETLRAKRAERIFRFNGGRASDWSYISPNQGMQIAHHESEDHDGLAMLDDANDALFALEPAYKSGAAMAGALDEAEALARQCAAHVGIDYNGLFPD